MNNEAIVFCRFDHELRKKEEGLVPKGNGGI
jgi:hypothetical protein